MPPWEGRGDSEREEEVEIEETKKDSAADYFESEDELIEEMRKEACSVEAYIGNFHLETFI